MANRELKSWQQALPKAGVILILGHRGTGKSALGWWLAECFHKKKRLILALGASREAKRLLPKWVGYVKDVQTLSRKQGAVIVVDEAAFSVMARRSQSDQNIMWSKMVAVSRHKDHLLIFITQHNRQLDVNLVGDADLVIFKRPSLLHIRFSRPELRPDVEDAYNQLLAKGRQAARWSVVKDFSLGRTGMLRNQLPKFWTGKLSKSFALIELENGKQKSKGEKRRRKV